MAEENKENSKDKKPGGSKGFSFYWVYVVIFVAIIGIQMVGSSGGPREITYAEFRQYVSNEWVQKAVIQDKSEVKVFLNEQGQEAKANDIADKPMFGSLLGKNAQFHFVKPEGDPFEAYIHGLELDGKVIVERKMSNTFIPMLLQWGIIIGLMVLVWVFLMRRLGGGGAAGGQIFNIGKSKAQLFEKGKGTNVTFKDVAGLEGAKEEIEEIVEFLKNPKKYTELGAKIPKGALLVGPPGTGKTLLAKAVAGEAQVPFFSLSGSDFVEMFVGVGASRVRDLFKQAKEKSPSIIFIDEIDAIGRARGKNVNMGSNDERENTLNQLLTEMDGFGTNSGVIILAATNRADILDKALMRAGRFDRQIYVDMPDLNERKEIFDVHLRPIKADTTIDVDFLARQTPGFSGADIANICNEAALIAARKDKKLVTKDDFLDAVDRIIGGLEKKNKIISPREKETIAYHEAGHAIVSWLLEYASPLVKVTIVPRGQSLGAAWYLPEERQLNTTEQIFDEMCAALGGRAAEDITFGKISTGALSDLEKVTKQAYAMVSIYGLNKRIGNISFYDSRGENQFTKPYSEATAKVIDEEVSKVIEKAYDRAKELLSANKDKLKALSNKLLEREVIFKDDLVEILGGRPEGWADSEVLHSPEAVIDSEVKEIKEVKDEDSADSDSSVETAEGTVE